MSRNYYDFKTKKFRKQPKQKQKYFGLKPESNILVKRVILNDEIPALVIRSFVPRSFLSKKALKKQDHELIPSKKCITITSFDAWDLISVLKRILPPREHLEPPENFFGPHTFPKGSIVQFPDGSEEITEHGKVMSYVRVCNNTTSTIHQCIIH